MVAIAGGIVLYVKNKRTKNELGNTAVVVSKTSSSKLQASEVANDPVIQIGILPADAISDETKLVEITDSKVLAHINNLVPGLAQAGNAANNATQAVKANGEVLYRAIIPAGAKLTDSKAMEGAVRGFYHGADGIRGHANLVAVEAQKGTAVAAMGVASMIVGQYYMTQINAELGVISDGISQIQNFQDNEYRSRVFSLVAHVKKIADFQTEILENDELRLSKIAQLDSLEEECTKLLGQANLTLAGFAKKSGLNYDGYEKALYDVDVRTINEHIKKIYSDSELEEDSTIRNFRIVQTEGSRQVTRDTKHYSLQMIIAVGFKVNSERAVQFRKWVNQIAKDYTIKGWVMDDERLKRGMYLTEKYFDEQLERMLNCSHRLRWPRSGYGCQFCHRLHLVAAVNMRFQNVWTCFRFDRICFREREQNLTSIRRYRAISRRLL